MKGKLTLSIDKQTKKRAKRYAEVTGHSISEMAEDFLNTIATEDDWEPTEGSVVADLAGSLPLDDDRPHKEILIEERSKSIGLMKILIDSDVCLDLLTGRKPHHYSANKLFNEIDETDLTAFVSPDSFP